jgi:hypothetical protein
MHCYYVEWEEGMAIVEAENSSAAENYMRLHRGLDHGPYRAKIASESDIEYYKSLGGVQHQAVPRPPPD